MFGVVYYYSSKLMTNNINKLPNQKSYKTEIKILANPALASSGFEQPGPNLCQSLNVTIKTRFYR